MIRVILRAEITPMDDILHTDILPLLLKECQKDTHEI